MIHETRSNSKPLVIYIDDDGVTRKTYSYYEINGEVVTFHTKNNKITIPIKNLVKIKESN